MDHKEYSLDDIPNIFESSVDDLFSTLVRRGNGGTTVHSLSAPPMATQFVKSRKSSRAGPGIDGSFSSIKYPSLKDVDNKCKQKHGNKVVNGYDGNRETDAYPAGYGERSARALAREETTYQLKGTFQSAALSFAKLKARIEARKGDVSAAEKFFSMSWGLPLEQTVTMPGLHVDGSEATRLAAMEDRAYHALSGHPSITGGYRVDTATLAPDAISPEVPLNWPRLRTGLKAIAEVQLQGDVELATTLRTFTTVRELSMQMDITEGSQRVYERPLPWETIFEQWVSKMDSSPRLHLDIRAELMASAFESSTLDLIHSIGMVPLQAIKKLAMMVSEESTRALHKTIDVILMFDRERALVIEGIEDDVEAAKESKMIATFRVPRYKVSRSTLKYGFSKERLGGNDLPDVTSHGASKRLLDVEEFRIARLAMNLDIPSALNLAVYLTTMNTHTRTYAYLLMNRVKPHRPDDTRPVSQSLRSQALYESDRVRELGPFLFSDFFMQTLSLLFGGIMVQTPLSDTTIKLRIWNYLARRCGHTRLCPVAGGWRDLIHELRDLPEGWTLYYWARISVGKRHKQLSTGILAPISAGQCTDFTTTIKRGIKERAKYWASYYASRYKDIEGELDKRKRSYDDPELQTIQLPNAKYIPPHRRVRSDLDALHDEPGERSQSYEESEYQQMVEMQSKSKFFAQLQVFTSDNQVSVGMTDAQIREVFIEFYQARWVSIDRRIEKAKRRGTVFRLGPHEFNEHPWGELCTNFPEDVDLVVAMMTTLDSRAWTIPPTYLLDKFRKSISELWGDINNEISTTLQYIDEAQSELAEDQDVALAAAATTDIMAAARHISPIVLPTPGYSIVSTLPNRKVEIDTGRRHLEIETLHGAIEQGGDNNELDELEDEDLGDYVLDTSSARAIVMNEEDTVMSTFTADHLSYRELWHTLGLPVVDDVAMRLGYGLAAEFDLDAPCTDQDIGTPILRGEEHRAMAGWKRKIPFIRMRCNLPVDQVLMDDM